MAALRKVGELSQKLFLRNRQYVYIAKRYKSEIDVDNLHDIEHPELKGIIPDPYPKTEEARLKAADKYNLHPDEYKPFPTDHRYCGDYPDLPEIGVVTKDPYYPWDFPETRRNYGETLPKIYNILGQDRFGYGPRERISLEKGAAICLLFFAIFLGLFYIAPGTSQPQMEKQYPGSKTHYTFELVK